MSNKKIPKNLQPFLWSVNVKKLDLQEDKIYIINQILAYGGLSELRWLFRSYSKKIIQKTFINESTKIYTRPGYNFIKNILLNLKDKKLDPFLYDRALPRLIRR